MNKLSYSFVVSCFLLSLSFNSCSSKYKVSSIEGTRVAIDSTYDAQVDSEAIDYLLPYKQKVDSMMNYVVGYADISMERGRPESLLGNLFSDMLRRDACMVLGKPADVGLMNIGGIRSNIVQGDITCGDVFEILPFQNALCVLTLKGKDLKQLFRDIALRGGEGISGATLVIDKKGDLLDCKIDGKPVDETKEYTIATLDYLADGNDGMTAFNKAIRRDCPDGATVRDLFMKYLEEQKASGKGIKAQLEGRITVK